LGNGDGTFQTGGSFAAGFGPVVTADFNRDGKLDLAVNDHDANSVDVLLGNGDGTFQAEVKYAVGEQPYSVAVVDVNGDGKQDLAAVNEFSGSVSVLLGKGNGTFQKAVNYATGQPLNLAVADFNRDGASDLVVAGPENTVATLLNTGGTFPVTTSSQNPSKLGQPVTFTTTVTPTFSFIGTPAGMVTFKDGTKLLGKAPLSGGQASLTTSSLSAGKHKISATYSGDSNFNPNTAPVLKQKVTR
jgi:hypothetical protein